VLPFERILWPTDFSNCSYVALRAAVELATQLNAELCLLYVVPPIPRPVSLPSPEDTPVAYGPELAEYEEQLHTSAQQKLHQVVETQVPRSIRTRLLIGHGDPATEIARIAEDERVGLVVVATHGMTGWRSLSLGSIAERLVRLSNRPVLSIRAPCEPTP
jgi:nucleotide-binding universal stress UspA family protein